MIRRYTLILDKACNKNCLYCHQGSCKPNPMKRMPNPKDVVNYFPKVGYYEIVLYGGEPLLHWEFLIEFCTIIRGRGQEIKLTIPTNGTLLTLNKAKILNDLYVNVVLSHDGRHHCATRRYNDLLIVNPDPYMALNSRSIASTCCSLNPNFYDVWDYFEEFRIKHGLEKRENVLIQLCKDVEGNTPEELFIYNNKEFEEMLDKVFAKLEFDILRGVFNSYEVLQYWSMIQRIKANLDAPGSVSVWCGMDREVCDLDVFGNVYSCHNQKVSIGAVNVVPPTGERSKYKNDPYCSDCSAYIYCGGGCPVASPTSRRYTCYTTRQQVERLLGVLRNL